MATQVTKATMIGELLQIDENIAPILLNIGMHCLGCPSSQMDRRYQKSSVCPTIGRWNFFCFISQKNIRWLRAAVMPCFLKLW